MPTIRERLTNVFLAPERKQAMEAASIFMEAYKMGPSILPPERLISRLAELDSRYVDLLMRQLQTNANMLEYKATEEDRIRTVYSARRLYDNDVISERSVNVWTDFGFGLHVTVTPRDPAAQEVWKEFWTSDENAVVLGQREIQNQSIQLLNDGDFMYVYFTDKLKTGKTKIRLVPTEQIKGKTEDGVIALPEDANTPVLYRREVTVKGAAEVTYYQDWRVTDEMLQLETTDSGNGFGAITSTLVPDDGTLAGDDGTQIRAMLVAHNRRGNRGWPLITTGMPWIVAYRDFLQDRAAVARAISMFVNKVSAEGGQRAIDAIATKLQSSLAASGAGSETNPRPTAGSTWVENKAATLERLPLNTGASDAQTDGSALLAQAALSSATFPHWFGRGESFRLATASAMEMPTLRAFNRYQLFWSSVWQDMAKYVLTAAVEFGGAKIKDFTVDVSTDAVIDVAIDDIQKSATSLNDMYDRGLIQDPIAGRIAEQLMRVVVETIGIGDTEEIFSPDLTPDEKAAQVKKDQDEKDAADKAAADAAAAAAQNKNPDGTIPPTGQPPEGEPVPESGDWSKQLAAKITKLRKVSER